MDKDFVKQVAELWRDLQNQAYNKLSEIEFVETIEGEKKSIQYRRIPNGLEFHNKVYLLMEQWIKEHDTNNI